jgi:DUF917 family protein
MRMIDRENLEDIALGATVLGTGGGGDPYVGKLMAMQAIRQRGPVRLLDPSEIEDNALVVQTAMMGAPTVMVEKLPNGHEIVSAFLALQEYLGRDVAYVTSAEAGGINSTIPFTVAARLDIPMVDADGMGRAFPELQMVTPTLHNIAATPMAIADEKGNSAVINAQTNKWTETMARTITIDMGSTALIALYPMTGRQLKDTMISGTLTKAEQIGRTLREARAAHHDPIRAVAAVTGGFEIFRGKVVDVQRRTETGFARGDAMFAGTEGYENSTLSIAFQNENLVAVRDDEIIVTVPDLITILDAETGDPITTEGLRYGFRVVVLGISCHPKWRSPAGIEVVGPRYFGYDVDYVPVEERFAQQGEA